MKIGVGEPNTECAGLTKRLRITYYAKKLSQFACLQTLTEIAHKPLEWTDYIDDTKLITVGLQPDRLDFESGVGIRDYR